MKKSQIVDPIDVALLEDIGQSDITTDFFVSKDVQAAARLVARERAIVAGTKTAADVFRRVDPQLPAHLHQQGQGLLAQDLRDSRRLDHG